MIAKFQAAEMIMRETLRVTKLMQLRAGMY